MAQLIIFLVFLGVLTRAAEGLSGYMCGTSSPNFTAVSTSVVGSCEMTAKSPDSKQVYIQLLQQLAYQHIDVSSCRILVDRKIRYCGAFSHNKLVQGGDSRYIHTLSKEACTDAIKFGQIKFENIIIRDLIVNITNRRSLIIAGSLSMDGACEGASFSSNQGQYSNVVVTVEFEISIFTYVASYDQKTNKLVMPSNLVCQYSKGQCIDGSEASYFWSPAPLNDYCNFDQYTILYEGESTRVQDEATNSPVIYFTNTTQNIQFGLEKVGTFAICGYNLIATEHSKLFILETSPNAGFASKKALDVENIIITAYFNTKFAYFAHHVKTQFERLYRDSVYHRCMLARQIILNSLSQIELHPDRFALAVMRKKGYSSILAGEVAYITACTEIVCQIRATELCYFELPVTCMGRKGFLKPDTKIFAHLGTPRECTPIFPSVFEVDGLFVQTNPNVSLAIKPHIIQPMENPSWNYEEIKNFMSSGIYSKQDLEALEDHLAFPMKKQALLESVIRRLADRPHPIENGNFQNLFDEDTFHKVTNSYFQRFYLGFLKFGAVCAGLMGVMVIVQLIKIVIDTLIHGYTLYGIYGWSIHLLGAFFNSITTMLIHAAGGRPRADQPGNEPIPRPRTALDTNQIDQPRTSPIHNNPIQPNRSGIALPQTGTTSTIVHCNLPVHTSLNCSVENLEALIAENPRARQRHQT